MGMIIKGYNVAPLLKKTVKEVGDDRISSLAAETAFYFFFSLFPLLLLLIPILGLVGNGTALINSLLGHLSATMPADSLSLLRRTLSEIASSGSKGGVMSIGVLLAGWSGSRIFGGLMEALNVAYDVKETRSFVRRLLIRLGCLAAAGAVVVVATLIFLDGERIATWGGTRFNLSPALVMLWSIAQLLLTGALLVSLGAVLYKVLPNVQQRWGQVWIASTFATVLWVVATLIFRLYVQHFGSYNKTYGAIGGVILLLSWMYYTMFVVLVGGELSSEINHGSGAVDPIRGNVYLGRIVSQEGPGTASMEKVKPSR